MDPFSLIERLEAGAAALSGVTAGMSSSQAAWRPAPDQWSLLEIACHLLDGREFAATMAAFAEERGRSLDWLRALRDPDWDAAYQHPKLGVIRAGDLLASWCAHDVLHLRQMARWHWRRLQDEAGPFGTGYAGQW